MGIVYTCFTTDVIHAGHLNIIREAQKYGDVVVGVMTDKALVQFDRFPTISFYERKKMVPRNYWCVRSSRTGFNYV